MKKIAFFPLALGMIALIFAASTSPTRQAAAAGPYACTMVIGFSQTRQWYNAGFEAAVGNGAAWQGLNVDGSTAIRIADPDEEIWQDWADGKVTSRCATSWQTPDRIILNISGVWNSDPAAWADLIAQAVATTRSKLGNPEIVLQPVVGGPGHTDCDTRASYNHPYVDEGIALAVAADPSLVVGFSPEVGQCSHYTDTKGHLSSAGGSYVAQRVAAFYATTEAPTATPTAGSSQTPTAAPSATPPPTATPGKTITECRVRTTYSDGSTRSRDVALSVCQGLE